MDPTLIKLFPFLAVLTPFLLFFGQIRALVSKIISIFIIRVELHNDTATAFNYLAQSKGKRWTLGAWRYRAIDDYSKIDKKRIAIGYEELGREPQILRIGRSFILCQNKSGNQGGGDYEDRKTTLYYIRGTFAHEAFLIEAMDFYNARQEAARFNVTIMTGDGKRVVTGKEKHNGYDPFGSESKSDVYKSNRILKYKREDLGSQVGAETLAVGYVFCSQAKALMADAERWFRSQQWYQQHGMLWRRGVLISGKQGSGKTTLVRKVCQKLDIPLYVFDLSSMSNKEFYTNWAECQSNTPCAVLFDDIDKVFDKQENIAGEQGGGLSFDALLSALSGAQPSEGMLVFCTANDVNKIDSTLACSSNGSASRPGRIDATIEINEMEEDNRRELAKQLFGESDVNLDEIVKHGEGMTAAQFNNYCTNISLDRFWSKQLSQHAN